MKRYIRYIVGIVIALAVMVFAFQNTVTVEVHFLAWQTAMPRAVLVFLVFGIGALFGWLLATLTGREKD